LAALLDPRIGASAAELRQMILSLAVQGKLVAQNDDDEPAQEYFWRLSNKNRKTNLYQSTIKDSNYELPKNWVCVLFGDLMINRDGERIPVNRDEREQKEKIYDYYGASGVIDKIDDYLFDKPLLLIGEDGANLVNRSSPIAFIARGKYWVNNHAHVLDATDEVLLKYMEIYINSIDLKPYITGTAQPKMNQAKMNSIPVFLPPLAEQERIVARVDELMALVDRLEALQERADAVGEQVLAGLVG
jgi:type I restriction enzyme S subunit